MHLCLFVQHLLSGFESVFMVVCVCVQVWCLWSRRVGRRQRRAARAISFKTCLHVGVWTLSVEKELISTTALGQIVRGESHKLSFSQII